MHFAKLCVAAALSLSSTAHAYLGGFENADGYLYFTPGASDVTNYNAGQHGANAGGGVFTPIPYDTGLWDLQSTVGDFFPNSAARTSTFGSAPPYPNTMIPGGVPAYIIGNHFGGRGGTTALAVRNATAAGTGTMQYDYRIDTYDTGGVAPASVTSGNVQMGFYFLPNDPDPVVNGVPSREKFVMSYADSAGNIGFQWGYNRDNSVIYRPGSTGPWVAVPIIADNLNYDGLKIAINLTTQTFGIQYTDVSPVLTTIPIAPLGTPLGATMSNFTHIGWSMVDNVTLGSLGGKNFFDDFSFVVPEPSSIAILGLGMVGVLARRRATN